MSFSQNMLYPKIDSLQLIRIEKLKEIGVPLFFLSVEVWHDDIGTPEVKIITKNICQKDVDAFTIEVHCYDNYNDPVNHYSTSTNIYKGVSQDILKAGKTVFLSDTWTLYGYDNTTKVKVYLIKVHFTDDTIWIPKDKTLTMVAGKTVL